MHSILLSEGATAHFNVTMGHWVYFVVLVLAALGYDMWSHRKPEEPSTRSCVYQTMFFIGLALAFNVSLYFLGFGAQGSTEWFAGWLTEYALSIDNLFVFFIILGSRAVPREYQQRVLSWGINLAILFRGLFFLGVSLVQRFEVALIIMAVYLIYKGWEAAKSDDAPELLPGETVEEARLREANNTFTYRLLAKLFPISPRYDGNKFITRKPDGKRKLTPMAVVLIAIGTTDIVFAIDSVPAVFSLTQDPYLAFTSNVFALLGLRSLFFLLANLARRLTRINEGLGLILGWVGATMLLGIPLANEYIIKAVESALELPIGIKLGMIIAIIIGTIIASKFWPNKTEEDVAVVVESDHTLAALYLCTGRSMDGEWANRLVHRYTEQLVGPLGIAHYDTDGVVPVYYYAEYVEEGGTLNKGDTANLDRPYLGDNNNLAAAIKHAARLARQTSGRHIAVFVNDCRLGNGEAPESIERAELAAQQAIAMMPANLFPLIVRVSDEPGGREFADALVATYNISTTRCDVIHATDDAGAPFEQIADVVGRKVEGWLETAPTAALAAV